MSKVPFRIASAWSFVPKRPDNWFSGLEAKWVPSIVLCRRCFAFCSRRSCTSSSESTTSRHIVCFNRAVQMDVVRLNSYIGNANVGFWKRSPGAVNIKWPVLPVCHCHPSVGIEGSFDKAIKGVQRLMVHPFMVGNFDTRECSTSWPLCDWSQLTKSSFEC